MREAMRNNINEAPQEEVTISKVKCDHVTMVTSEEVNTLTEVPGIIKQIHPRSAMLFIRLTHASEKIPD